MRKKTVENFVEENPNTIVIIIRGGTVQDVYNIPSDSIDDYQVIDFDDLEDGFCPLCGKNLGDEAVQMGGIICPRCGFAEA